MGTQYLIDSNVVIDYLSAKLPPNGMSFMNLVVNAIPRVSIITKIEILGYKTPDESSLILSNFMADSDVIGLSDSIVYKTIELRKHNKIKLPDAIIAATALVNGLVLLSRNLSDFNSIEGLDLIDPHTLDISIIS